MINSSSHPVKLLVIQTKNQFDVWYERFRHVENSFTGEKIKLKEVDAIPFWNIISSIHCKTVEEGATVNATDAYRFYTGSTSSAKLKLGFLINNGIIISEENSDRRNEKLLRVRPDVSDLLVGLIDDWMKDYYFPTQTYYKYRLDCITLHHDENLNMTPVTYFVSHTRNQFLNWTNGLRELFGDHVDENDAITYWNIVSGIYCFIEEQAHLPPHSKKSLRTTDAYRYSNGRLSTGKNKVGDLIKAGIVVANTNMNRRNEKFVTLSDAASTLFLDILDKWTIGYLDIVDRYESYRRLKISNIGYSRNFT